MSKVNLLDCTLRDGGYINSWNFGFSNITGIVNNLIDSGIDFIEIGFLNNKAYSKDRTCFNEISQINEIIPVNKSVSKIVAMIVFGQFDVSKIIKKTDDIRLDGIRVTFKKKEILEIFPYLKVIKDAGYDLFVNPTNIDMYSDSELIQLIEQINELDPYCFSIVDTNGVLRITDIRRLYYLIDNNLNKNISLCFHSHNNLQLSFSNAQALMDINSFRNLIIDASIFGMGRGAGNLCIELVASYINETYGNKYDIVPILKSIDETINLIFNHSPWGYSVPYYLASINKCHPNYAKYLSEKSTLTVELVNTLLNMIPVDKRSIYDETLITKIYLEKFSKIVDDSDVVSELSSIMKDRIILILAPGKSLQVEQDVIEDFIFKNNPFIVSLNFKPSTYKEDMVFVSNIKRASQLKNTEGVCVVATSNIENPPEGAKILNYASYLNDSMLYDSVALMFFSFLIKIGVDKVYVAGLDGFEHTSISNYVDESLISLINIERIDRYNELMKTEIERFNRSININFITTSKYIEKTKN